MNDTRNRKTILVVDDMPENIDVLASMLKSEYVVKAATSGRMALQIATSDPPDLILLDIMMPGMDGKEMLRLLKEDERTRTVPVVFVSGRDKSDMLSDTDVHDVAACLYKPLVPDEVMRTVRRCIT
jgi:CheY-like chemotaxis protein